MFCRLSDTAKKVFYELGSSLIHDIKFRASWYFIGQKGIDSFSPFEDLFVPTGNDWAQAIDIATCVPVNREHNFFSIVFGLIVHFCFSISGKLFLFC